MLLLKCRRSGDQEAMNETEAERAPTRETFCESLQMELETSLAVTEDLAFVIIVAPRFSRSDFSADFPEFRKDCTRNTNQE